MSKMSVVAGKVLVDAQSIGMSEVEQALGLLLDDNGRPMCVSCVCHDSCGVDFLPPQWQASQ